MVDGVCGLSVRAPNLPSVVLFTATLYIALVTVTSLCYIKFMNEQAKKVLLLLAPGFEEVEALTPVDYLRRAGIEVCTAAVGSSQDNGKNVTGSYDIVVKADVLLTELDAKNELSPAAWDAVIVPGGMPGSANIAGDSFACEFLKNMAKAGKLICAICAAPAVVLGPLGLLEGRNFTCYPGLEEKVSGAFWREDRVVVDKNIITSRAAGTAGEFSMAIIASLLSQDIAKELAGKVLL